MKISQRKLKQIIKEEITKVLKEQNPAAVIDKIMANAAAQIKKTVGKGGKKIDARKAVAFCANRGNEGHTFMAAGAGVKDQRKFVCKGGKAVPIGGGANQQRLEATDCKPGQDRRCAAMAQRLGLPAEPDGGRHAQEWGCTKNNKCGKIGGG